MALQIPPMAKEATLISINLKNKGLQNKIWKKKLKKIDFPKLEI